MINQNRFKINQSTLIGKKPKISQMPLKNLSPSPIKGRIMGSMKGKANDLEYSETKLMKFFEKLKN